MAISKNSIGYRILLVFLLVAMTVSIFVIPSKAASYDFVTITPQMLAAYFEQGMIEISCTFTDINNVLVTNYIDSWFIQSDGTIWFYSYGSGYSQVWGGSSFSFNISFDLGFNYTYKANEVITFCYFVDYEGTILFDFDDESVSFYNDNTFLGGTNNANFDIITPAGNYGIPFFSEFYEYAESPAILECKYYATFDYGTVSNYCNRLVYNGYFSANRSDLYGQAAIGLKAFDIYLSDEQTTRDDTTIIDGPVDDPDEPGGGGGSGGSGNYNDVVDRLDQIQSSMNGITNSMQYQNDRIDEIVQGLFTPTDAQDQIKDKFENDVNDYINDITSADAWESNVVGGFESFFGEYTNVDEMFGAWPESDVGSSAPVDIDPFIGHKVIGVIFSIVAICAILHTLIYGRW